MLLGERLRRRPLPKLHKDLAERARLVFGEPPLKDLKRRLRAAPRQSTDEAHERRTDGGRRPFRGKRTNNGRRVASLAPPIQERGLPSRR